MTSPVPERLLVIAGRGAYPHILIESARAQGVRHIAVIAFPGETERAVARAADEVRWVPVGALRRFLDAVRELGIRDAVMAGQIAPTNLFRVRPDADAWALLKSLPAWNARTIFGAVVRKIEELGIRVHRADSFMETAMPPPGVLTRRPPDDREQADIQLGRRVAKATSALEVGQTVVVKDGVILAVEAFEGTDEAIRRGGRLGGPGAVVVKTARTGHDMRYDIPVVGLQTMKVLRKARASALAVEAGRTILLERPKLIELADRWGMSVIAFPASEPVSPEEVS